MSKVKCSVGGCGREEERERALMPPLKTLAEYLGRRVTLEDLEKNAVCGRCARDFVSVAQEEAKKSGSIVGQLFHYLPASEAEVRRREKVRQAEVAERHTAEEEARKFEAEARKRRITSLGVVFAAQFARIRAGVVEAEERQAEVIVHPTAAAVVVEVKPTAAKKALRKRAKKAVAG